MEKLKIEYNGSWPCLCMGQLKVWIGETLYDFGKHILITGGRICKDKDCNMWAEKWTWSINRDNIPENFPEDRIEDLLREINNTIPQGCCGGCI